MCAHTISYGAYKDVRLDGRALSEGEMFALAATQRGVPTALIAGDDVVAGIMEKVCPGIETAVVKRALSREAAVIIPPVRAQRLIHAAATRAVERLRAGEIDAPEAHPPFAIEVELRNPITAETEPRSASGSPSSRSPTTVSSRSPSTTWRWGSAWPRSCSSSRRTRPHPRLLSAPYVGRRRPVPIGVVRRQTCCRPVSLDAMRSAASMRSSSNPSLFGIAALRRLATSV